MRKPSVAGQFYEKEPEKLKKEIEKCFLSDFGPKKLPQKFKIKDLDGVIVPHAGYFFSGACAAWAYKEIAESKKPDFFLLLGLNHFGYENGISDEEWETPLGIVETDKEIIEILTKNTSLKVNNDIHIHEHSIEVQLPFLQFIYDNKKENLPKIVPIMIGHADYKKLGKEIEQVLKGKNFITIVSSDFTHYGINYNYIPFYSDIKNNITKLDNGAIEKILNFDDDGFKEYIKKTGITICGYMPILVFLVICKIKGNLKGQLLKYYTSADVIGDYRNSVSYASIAFRKTY